MIWKKLQTIIFILLVSLIIVNCGPDAEALLLNHAGSHNKNNETSQFINIYLIPHSHSDLGWYKTVDGYFYGQRYEPRWLWSNATQTINAVMSELLVDESKRFIQAELGFFGRWYLQQNENVRNQLKKLIAKKQFTIQGGGWVVTDEACTYYEDIIDEVAVGHQLLDQFLGFKPTIGWQQDPFGHSYSVAYLFSQMGFHSMMMSRIDYQEQLLIQDQKKLQFLWDLPYNSTLFTQIFYWRYTIPGDFAYDYRWTYDKKPPSENQSKQFANYLRNVSFHYHTNEFANPLGDDFAYGDADYSFRNYGKYISDSNKLYSENTKMQYATPEEFLEKLNQKKQSYQLFKKDDDFFPYRDKQSDYWTGYFTSRPYLKRFVRESSNYLQKVRNFINALYLFDTETASEIQNRFKTLNFGRVQNSLLKLEQEVATMQHHDAVTGTNKEDVGRDYVQRTLREKKAVVENMERLMGFKFQKQYKEQVNLTYCAENFYQNQECEIKMPKIDDDIILNIYNPDHNQSEKETIIKFKGFQELKDYEITDEFNNRIQGEMITTEFQDQKNQTPTIYFKAKLRPFQSTIFKLSRNLENPSIKVIQGKLTKNSFTAAINNNTISLNQSDDFLMYNIGLKNKNYKFSLQHLAYNDGSSGSSYSSSNSGLYIFTVKDKDGVPNNYSNFKKLDTQFEVFQGSIVTQINCHSYVPTVITLNCLDDVMQIRSNVKLNYGEYKEVVLDLKFQNIRNNGVFYTDSNGLFKMKRTVGKYNNYMYEDDFNNKVSGNYYPVTRFLSIKDSNTRITCFNDRTQGGSSLVDGQIQLMIQRQTSTNDNKGLTTGCDDSNPYLIDHFLLFDESEDDERRFQAKSDLKYEIYHGLLKQGQYTLQPNLQKNKKLFDLPKDTKFYIKYLKDNLALVRVQNTLEKKEIQLNISKFSKSIEYQSDLTGTRSLCNLAKEKIDWKVENQEYRSYTEEKRVQELCRQDQNKDFNRDVTVRPQEMKAFVFSNKQIQISKETLWERVETNRQEEYCTKECFQKGLCIFHKCYCFSGTTGDKCQDKCSVENCDLCYKSSCDVCKIGYQLANGQCMKQNSKCEKGLIYDKVIELCVQCSYYAKCEGCDENGCSKCLNGYYLSYNKQCEKCQPGLPDCPKEEEGQGGQEGNNEQNKCQDGQFYDEQLKTCQKCFVSCLKCTNWQKCDLCDEKQGYVMDLDRQICVKQDQKCSIDCIECENKIKCLKCLDGFDLIQGQCQFKCLPLIMNCQNCSDSSEECDTCNQGYYVDINKKCQKCELSGCSECNSPQVCLNCDENHYLDENKQCQKCSKIPNCRKCGQTGCEVCQDYYFLNQNTGSCQNCLPNCRICSGQKVCFQCNRAYKLDKNGRSCQVALSVRILQLILWAGVVICGAVGILIIKRSYNNYKIRRQNGQQLQVDEMVSEEVQNNQQAEQQEHDYEDN